MQLKDYQQNALEQLDRWLEALKKAHLNSQKVRQTLEEQDINVSEELENYPRAAWNTLKEQNVLPGIAQDSNTEIPDYISRTAASDEPIPHACMRIPTGGGKTLLGVAALDRIKHAPGFVLWIVPTKAIYEQTLKAFRNREHPYRQMLERASGGKVKLLQKTDRFTKQDVDGYLCIMVLMLPSVNRQTGREFLKIFRDSGGYISFFPEQDDVTANKKLSKRHPDLEKNETGGWIKQSLINVLKQVRPTVILDEAHKAYGRNDANNKEFVKSVNRLNPRLVLELSATPKVGVSNILVNVSGGELQAEEMIKLPIEIHSFSNSDWKRTLAETKGKLDKLARAAQKLQSKENRYIRPMALVRVERTGASQREQGKIHAEDAKKYLIRNLAVPENQIRIQSSEQKELAGEDLLSEQSPVRWIITKDALKEGWDCSFAYLLALLDSTKAPTAMTQMVGRVMRQPQAHRIKDNESLNRCAIYCYNQDVGKAVEKVKAGLEQEGLTGLSDSVCGYDGGDAPEPITIKRRGKYRRLKIFLPRVLHKEGRKWRPIDYHRDILSTMDWDTIDGGEAVSLAELNTMQAISTTVDIQGQGEVSEEIIETGESLTLDYFVRRVVDLMPNPWQAARAAKGFIRKHQAGGHDDSKLLINRIHLSEVLRDRIKKEIEVKAEAAFRDKIRKDDIQFRLDTDERLNYELERSFEVFVSSQERSLQGEHGKPIQQSLFEPVYESNFNNLEKAFALYLEGEDAIHWWHKIAARQEYSLQGWLRQRIYPDFVACRKEDGKLYILETKGIHLKGNEDTNYKKKLLETLERAYKTALDRGKMQVREPPAVFRMLFEDNWREQADSIFSDDNKAPG